MNATDNAETLRARARQLDQEAANLRSKLQGGLIARGRARATLAKAIQMYQSEVRPVTDLENRREFLKASNAERAAQAEGRGGTDADYTRPGNSFIDRAAMGKGDASTFVRKGLKHGGS